MNLDEKFMTAEEVADCLRATKYWVHAHASGRRKPRLVGYKAGPKSSKAHWRFRREDVVRFIEQLKQS